MSSTHLVLPGSSQVKQLSHLHTQPSLGQSCHRQIIIIIINLASMHTGLLQLCPTLLCQGILQQEYWSLLANTCCHTLLEHYIS